MKLPRLVFALALLLLCQPLAIVPTAFAESEDFGKTADGTPVKLLTLKNDSGMVVKLINYGATVVEIQVPDRDGKMDNVVLGFDDIKGYESEANQYFGCIAGRVANRIAKGEFKLDGKTYKLAVNNGPNHLHGGVKRSLSKVVWDAKEFDKKGTQGVVFTYTSPDGEEGYPGKVDFKVVYSLNNKNALKIDFFATTDKATPINLAHHGYFNLGGAGSKTVLDHVLLIHADNYTPTDDTLIPTGKIEPVKDTPLDFTKPTRIGKRMKEVNKTAAGGYDHNYVLNKSDKKMTPAARLVHPKSGRVMFVRTTQPGLQFYSGNFLNGQTGRDGKTYAKRSALCLETQHFPDSVNHANFPTVILQPDATYEHSCVYQFGIAKKKEKKQK